MELRSQSGYTVASSPAGLATTTARSGNEGASILTQGANPQEIATSTPYH